MNQQRFLRDTTTDIDDISLIRKASPGATEARVFPWIRPLVGFTLLLVVLQEAVSAYLGTPAPHDYLSPTMQAPTALGAFALVCILAPAHCRNRIILLGLLLEGTRWGLQWLTGRPLINLMLFPGFGLGVAAWGVLAWHVLRTQGTERQKALDTLVASLALPIGNLLLWPCVFSMIPFLPHLYDNALLRLDASLGTQPAALVGLLFREVSPLFALHIFVYVQLPLALCIVAALEARSGRRLGAGLLPTSLAAAAIGYFLYIAMPAVGPRPYFGDDFAQIMLQLEALPSAPLINTSHPRNVMPSLHVTWALLIYLTARQVGRRVELAAMGFAVATALATLGLGEHYFIDLVVAVSLVLLVRAFCAFDVPLARPERWGAMALGVASLAGWALIVRDGTEAMSISALAPVLMGASILVCFAAERILRRAERNLPALALWPVPVRGQH